MKMDYFSTASDTWEQGRLKVAFRNFLRAAKQGNVSAQLNLAHFYAEGIWVRRNQQKSRFWLESAASLGYGPAARNIGVMYRNEGNFSSAERWFKRALQLGDSEAKLDLGKLFLKSAWMRNEAKKLFAEALSEGMVSEDSHEELIDLMTKLE